MIFIVLRTIKTINYEQFKTVRKSVLLRTVYESFKNIILLFSNTNLMDIYVKIMKTKD